MFGVFAALALVMQGGGWSDYDAADAQLSAAYDVLRAHLSPAARITLRDSERNWIAERNKACGFETRGACATRLTERRTRVLEADITRQRGYLSLDDKDLLALEGQVNEACRGGAGQDPDGVICKRRDQLYTQLQSRGWCWGPDSAEAEYQRHWMRAGRACRLRIAQ